MHTLHFDLFTVALTLVTLCSLALILMGIHAYRATHTDARIYPARPVLAASLRADAPASPEVVRGRYAEVTCFVTDAVAERKRVLRNGGCIVASAPAGRGYLMTAAYRRA